MGKIIVSTKKIDNLFPPIGFPDKIEINGAGYPVDGVYKKIIGNIIVPPFANFNQGFYYINNNSVYLGPINTDVRWLSVADGELYGIGGATPDRLPYNGSDWASPPLMFSTITLVKGGNLKLNKLNVTYLKSSDLKLFEYVYKDSPFNELGSILINLFDPTTDTGIGDKASLEFYDGSIENNTATNWIDVYSDGENWRDWNTDEILNDLPIAKGKSLIFYTNDFSNINYPINYEGGIIIQKLKSGKIQTDPPIPPPPPPDPRILSTSATSPLGVNPAVRVIINTDQDFSNYLSLAGYEINSYKQFIFDTYGININFNQHFIVLEAQTANSIPPIQYKFTGNNLDILVGAGIVFPSIGNYFALSIFIKNLNYFNTARLFAGNYDNQIQQITF